MKYLVTVNGDAHEVKLISKNGSQLSFELGGKVFTTNVEPMISFASAGSVAVAAAPSAAPKESGPVDGNIRAPMPGIVVSVAVKDGDEISAGQTVLVMEAMKMENNITASGAGKVKKIHVAEGEEVQNHQLLIELE